MKVRNRLSTLIFLLVSFYVHGQIPIDHENVNCFPSEKTGPANNFAVKSASENIFLLDSVLSTHLIDEYSKTISKEYHKYDDRGNEVEFSFQVIDSDLNLQQWYHTVYKYDDYNNCIVEFDYRLDYSTMKLVQNRKTEREFDNQGNILSYVIYSDDPPFDGLDYYSKAEFTYNENSQLIKSLEYVWDVSLTEWIPLTLIEKVYENEVLVHRSNKKYNTITQSWITEVTHDYYFDINGYDSLSIATQWSYLDSAYSQTKYEYKVDTLGNILERIYSTQDTLGNWQEFDKITSEYDDYGNKISEIDFNWNSIELSWTPNRKNEMEFNSNNQETLMVEFKWDKTLNDWIYFRKSEREYNSSDLLYSSIILMWDNTLSEWINRSKTTYEYDTYNNLTLESEYDWTDADSWWLDGKIEYFYSEFITNTNTNIAESQFIKLYPNPANETLTIETQNLETTFAKLLDSTGRLIKTLPIVTRTNTYNISELESGVYFIRIPQKEEMVVRKFVKN